MMKSILIGLFLGISFGLSAQSLSNSSGNDGSYDMYLVLQGETLYGLSKKYHTSVENLLKLNPDITNNNLQHGKLIKVPVVKDLSWLSSDEGKKKAEDAISHKVRKGETVYSLSKRYHTPEAAILMWNDLKEPAIREGQELIVGFSTPERNIVGPVLIEEELVFEDENVTLLDNEKVDSSGEIIVAADETNNLSLHNSDEASLNLILFETKGIATWTHSTYDNGNFYALHASAPKGTEIAVKNLMNNRTVMVKVIGRLPATSDNENVIIKLSESAARKLNVLDQKFLVQIIYTAPEDTMVSKTN